MAHGAITRPSSSFDFDVTNKKFRIRDVQLTSGANYTTGGETITAKEAGMSHRITAVSAPNVAMTSDGATSRSVGFLHQSDGSVKMVVSSTASAQVASNTDLSTYSIRLTFIGH